MRWPRTRYMLMIWKTRPCFSMKSSAPDRRLSSIAQRAWGVGVFIALKMSS